eukprot:jgi/Mesvir1/19250/Mv03500-RA.1
MRADGEVQDLLPFTQETADLVAQSVAALPGVGDAGALIENVTLVVVAIQVAVRMAVLQGNERATASALDTAVTSGALTRALQLGGLRVLESGVTEIQGIPGTDGDNDDGFDGWKIAVIVVLIGVPLLGAIAIAAYCCCRAGRQDAVTSKGLLADEGGAKAGSGRRSMLVTGQRGPDGSEGFAAKAGGAAAAVTEKPKGRGMFKHLFENRKIKPSREPSVPKIDVSALPPQEPVSPASPTRVPAPVPELITVPLPLSPSRIEAETGPFTPPLSPGAVEEGAPSGGLGKTVPTKRSSFSKYRPLPLPMAGQERTAPGEIEDDVPTPPAPVRLTPEEAMSSLAARGELPPVQQHPSLSDT